MIGDQGMARRRGQPLAALGALLAGWVALRALAWMPEATLAERPVVQATPENGSLPTEAKLAQAAPDSTAASAIAEGHAAPPPKAGTPRTAPTLLRGAQPFESPSPSIAASFPVMRPRSQDRQTSSALADPASSSDQFVLPGAPPSIAARRRSRWSGDGWVLYRRGSEAPAAAGLLPRYGASQAGGVIRYALAPSSPRAPQAHMRASRALYFAQSEAAAGLSLRPLPGIPARVLAEARVQREAGRTRLRPAVAAISELPPVRLPLGALGELYAQAGYVGGEQATPFFDAQATVERPLLATGPAELRLGGGAWAGGQEGSARLDVGPRASVKLSLGEASSRLAFDWRFRVAGNASPGSGPAVTFSAGF